MWHIYRKTQLENINLFESVKDLHESILRKLVLVFSILYLSWVVFDSMARPARVQQHGLILVTLVVVCGLVLYLIPRHLLFAQLTCHAGITMVITLTLMVYRVPEIGFLFALLPLMAIVTLDVPWAVVIWVLLMCWLWIFGVVMGSLPVLESYLPWIGLGGIISALIGWAATSTFTTLLEWFSYSYSLARQNVEEARDQRVELTQVQDDLVLANRELARLSDRLRAMTIVAEDSLKAKEEFVANVSHELRTPLNMIIGFTEMIAKSQHLYGGRLAPKLLADIAAIQRNAQHLSELVNDVLDLSQVEVGRMAITREWVSLKEIVHQAAEQVRALFESKNLSLQIILPEGDLNAFCDHTRIREVIINLLSNAGRFTEQGGVMVRADRGNNEIVVRVSDTGPGISEENQDRVFEPFQQLDSSIRRRHGGSGLGLAISKRFIEMHEGRMWLESEVGVGTTFLFSIPIEAPTTGLETGPTRWLNPYQQYEKRTRPFKAPVPRVDPRYLLLEEEEILARLFRRYLRNVEVVSVPSLDAAVDELSRTPAQALVINSPSARGGEILKPNLADLPFGTPVLSCWVPGYEAYARQLGVVRYLIKPVSGEDMVAALLDLGKEISAVLVVDDEPEMLQLFSRILTASGQGYRVLQASDGRQAIEMMHSRKPQAVFLDLMMPEMDGFEVLREMQRDEELRVLPVVVVSSLDPAGAPIVSDTLNITRSGGLSLNDLLAITQMIGSWFFPGGRPADPTPPKEILA